MSDNKLYTNYKLENWNNALNKKIYFNNSRYFRIFEL